MGSCNQYKFNYSSMRLLVLVSAVFVAVSATRHQWYDEGCALISTKPASELKVDTNQPWMDIVNYDFSDNDIQELVTYGRSLGNRSGFWAKNIQSIYLRGDCQLVLYAGRNRETYL